MLSSKTVSPSVGVRTYVIDVVPPVLKIWRDEIFVIYPGDTIYAGELIIEGKVYIEGELKLI